MDRQVFQVDCVSFEFVVFCFSSWMVKFFKFSVKLFKLFFLFFKSDCQVFQVVFVWNLAILCVLFVNNCGVVVVVVAIFSILHVFATP